VAPRLPLTKQTRHRDTWFGGLTEVWRRFEGGRSGDWAEVGFGGRVGVGRRVVGRWCGGWAIWLVLPPACPDERLDEGQCQARVWLEESRSFPARGTRYWPPKTTLLGRSYFSASIHHAGGNGTQYFCFYFEIRRYPWGSNRSLRLSENQGMVTYVPATTPLCLSLIEQPYYRPWCALWVALTQLWFLGLRHGYLSPHFLRNIKSKLLVDSENLHLLLLFTFVHK